MDDEVRTVQLALTPDEVSILKDALKGYIKQQKRWADKYQVATGNNPVVSNSKRAKMLLAGVEALTAEHEQDAIEAP